MNYQIKTHEVLDLHYLPSEGQGCFVGTLKDCEEFIATQSPSFMYAIQQMTKEEIENYPDNIEPPVCFHKMQDRVTTHRGYHCNSCGKRF